MSGNDEANSYTRRVQSRYFNQVCRHENASTILCRVFARNSAFHFIAAISAGCERPLSSHAKHLRCG
jgi:hypothetical protein